MNEWTKETRQRASGRNARPFFPPSFLLTHPSQSVARNRFVGMICVSEFLFIGLFFSIDDDLRFNPLLDINMIVSSFNLKLTEKNVMMMMESTKTRRRRKEKKREGKRNFSSYTIPSCALFTGNVGRGGKGYSSLSYVCTLFFLLDEHDLPLYSSFFPFSSRFFFVISDDGERKANICLACTRT